MLSEETATRVRRLTKRYDDQSKENLNDGLQRLADNFEKHRTKTLEYLLTSLPQHFPPTERDGVIALVREQYPVHMSHMEFDNVMGYAMSSFELHREETTIFSPPQDLEAIVREELNASGASYINPPQRPTTLPSTVAPATDASAIAPSQSDNQPRQEKKRRSKLPEQDAPSAKRRRSLPQPTLPQPDSEDAPAPTPKVAPKRASKKNTSLSKATSKKAALNRAAPKTTSEQVAPDSSIPGNTATEEAVAQENVAEDPIADEPVPEEGMPKRSASRKAAARKAAPRTTSRKNTPAKKPAPRRSATKTPAPENVAIEETAPESTIPDTAIPESAISGKKVRETVPKRAAPKKTGSKVAAAQIEQSTATGPTDWPRHKTNTIMTMHHKNSFIFSRDVGGKTRHFTLFCPSNTCQSPAFSDDPFEVNRAIEHFEGCSIPFTNEEDIFNRFAWQVITHVNKTPDRLVNPKWVQAHNGQIGPSKTAMSDDTGPAGVALNTGDPI